MTLGIMYYHPFTDEVCQLATYYFLALNSPSLPCFVILGLDPVNISLLSHGAVLVFINREPWRNAARPLHRKGLIILVWDALSPLKYIASGVWETQQCSLSREFLYHSAVCFLRINSGPLTFFTKFLNLVGFPY